MIAFLLCIIVGVKALEECACFAQEQKWNINCRNVEFVNTSLSYLNLNACNTNKCKTDAGCRQSFFVLNAHHDYCQQSDLPQILEEAVHTYESFCDQCKILRQYNLNLPNCPQPACSNPTIAVNAFNYLQARNCATNCATAECGANYRTIRAYHDLCDENAIPTIVEEGIHDFEEPCEAQNCNPSSVPFDPNFCTRSQYSSSTINSQTNDIAIAGVVLATIAIVLILVAFIVIGWLASKGNSGFTKAP